MSGLSQFGKTLSIGIAMFVYIILWAAALDHPRRIISKFWIFSHVGAVLFLLIKFIYWSWIYTPVV